MWGLVATPPAKSGKCRPNTHARCLHAVSGGWALPDIDTRQPPQRGPLSASSPAQLVDGPWSGFFRHVLSLHRLHSARHAATSGSAWDLPGICHVKLEWPAPTVVRDASGGPAFTLSGVLQRSWSCSSGGRTTGPWRQWLLRWSLRRWRRTPSSWATPCVSALPMWVAQHFSRFICVQA